MLEMKSRSALIALITGTTLAIVACGEDDGGGGNMPAPTGTDPVVTPTGTAPQVTPTVTPTGTVGPTGSNTVGPVGATGPGASGPGATGGTAGVDPAPTCAAPPATPAPVPINAVYGFSDETTTYEITEPSPGTLCLTGTAVDSNDGDDMYGNWGAGLGLQVGTDDDTGYDAAMLGIAGVQFELSMVEGRPVRVQMTLANIPEITTPAENFGSNAYGWGTTPKNITMNGPAVVPFDEFKLPSWSMIPAAYKGDLDATRLNALQVQIANNPGDAEEPYSFCVSNMEWINACGEVVATSTLAAPTTDTTDTTDPDPMGDGGAVDMTDGMEGDAGGMDTTVAPEDDAGTGGGDTTGDETTGTDPVEMLEFATDVHPILTAKCGQCHGAMPNGKPAFAVDDATAAETVALANAANIKDRITRAPGAEGHMPLMTAPDLTAEEEATLVEWVDSQ